MAPHSLLPCIVALLLTTAAAAPQQTDGQPDAGSSTTSGPVDAPEAGIEAQVEQGRMQGTVLQSRGGRRIYAFRGIPYAVPPIGELRFLDPLPIAPWVGVLNASIDGSDCVQKNYLVPPYPVTGSEDCLFLNVYTPKVMPPYSQLPVIVYFHGGGFFAGSGASHFLGPQYLLDEDVVLVTANYRLGALGFLSSGDERAPGNAGLKDQSLVLRWVHDNIGAFGGDPGCVTIMGESAGAAAVHLHMLSPLSRGLFHRAISQSGSALAPWARPTPGAPLALKQAQFAGCGGDPADMDAAMRCLRQLDAHELAEAGHKFHFWSVDPLTVFRPVVEPAWPGAFLIDDPALSVQMGAFARVPWLFGSVSNEGIVRALPILSDKELVADLNARWDELMPKLMELSASLPPHLVPEIWTNISQFYFNDTKPSADLNNPQPFIDLYSDRAFLTEFARSAELHARAGHKHIFLYEFAYRGRFSYTQLFSGGNFNYGASHIDDLLYLFYQPALFPYMPEKGSLDAKMTDALVQMWVNFAKYGDPTPPFKRSPNAEDTTDVMDKCWSSASAARWTPYQPSGALRWTALPSSRGEKDNYALTFLHLDADYAGDNATVGVEGEPRFCMRKGFHQERLDFWRSLPLEENKITNYSHMYCLSLVGWWNHYYSLQHAENSCSIYGEQHSLSYFI